MSCPEDKSIQDNEVPNELDDDNKSIDAQNASVCDERPQKRMKLKRGQNKGRKFANSSDGLQLCLQTSKGELCSRSECRASHDIEAYMRLKPSDLPGSCPAIARLRHCPAGLRCRWSTRHADAAEEDYLLNEQSPLENVLDKTIMIALRHREYRFPKAEHYLKELSHLKLQSDVDQISTLLSRPREKKRIVWENKRILAPLTTTGNLPFRQICRGYGADITYSEMAVATSLLKGNVSEWALTRSHQSERAPAKGRSGIYGVQIAGSKSDAVTKAVEVLADQMHSTLDFVDLNCGCPIDLIYNTGAGSALLDNQGKLLKMLRGMSIAAGDIPITCKLRTGVSDKKHTAGKLLVKLQSEACISMVTLHGRSRQQRYARSANWSYIAECAAQIKAYRIAEEKVDLKGSQAEVGDLPSLAFVGNGDVYSYEDWNRNMLSGVDACMIGRGALIKPWIFEEITAQQHIDKTATERLNMLGEYCRNGLCYWGTDQMGVDKTRRFFLEFMSFHHRYVPISFTNQAPLAMNERAPAWTARDETEALLASTDCGDWIKLSEIFLGKAADSFKFIPKHKANMVESEG